MAAAETQRATETDDEDRVESGTSPTALPTAVIVPPKGDAPAAPPDPFRWIRRGSVMGALVLGWTLILYFNRFNLSAPTVFVCLAYLAVVLTGYALWRTGMVVVVEDDDESDSTWGRPLGRRTELEREKRTLLKAIKEAEFDREMGKLSKADADEMIAVYRVRAIEAIKEIDQMDAGSLGTVREQIERELKARLELDAKAEKAKKDALADAAKDKKKKEAAKAKPAAKDSKQPATTAAEASSDVEASKTEASKTEASKTEASKTEASKTEASTTGASNDVGSKTEPSKSDASKTTDASTTDASTTDAPSKSENPSKEATS
jgi:hypothetical protein